MASQDEALRVFWHNQMAEVERSVTSLDPHEFKKELTLPLARIKKVSPLALHGSIALCRSSATEFVDGRQVVNCIHCSSPAQPAMPCPLLFSSDDGLLPTVHLPAAPDKALLSMLHNNTDHASKPLTIWRFVIHLTKRHCTLWKMACSSHDPRTPSVGQAGFLDP